MSIKQMPEDRGLNLFSSAYQQTFKHYEENILMLSSYADNLVSSLKKQRPTSLLSLGIGHRVVCTRLFETMDGIIDSYVIVEGATKIIDALHSQGRVPRFVRTEHDFFEKYSPKHPLDAVEMGFVLEHVDDPSAILQRYRSFLAPGGVLYAAVPNARSLHRLLGHKAGLLDDLYRLSEADLQLGHQRYYDLDSFCELLCSQGFEIKRVVGLLLKPFTTAQMNSLKLSAEVLQSLCVCAEELPAISNAIMVEATSKNSNA